MMKHQIPSTKHQIMTEIPITKNRVILNKLHLRRRRERSGTLGHWVFENWNLFGIWNLVIGI
jgi:hypothetical protein